MNFKLEQEFSKTDIIHQVDELKKQIDAMRPLPADVEGKVMQKLRLDWNYHSNAIEGNLLNYGETVAFLMEGITAKGKPLKDHLDIRGHNDAIKFLLDIVKDSRPLSETDIRALHKMILVEEYDVPAQTTDGTATSKRIKLGEYKTSANHVRTATGETHYYATPEETPAKMQQLMEWYTIISVEKDVHPLVIAALFHHKFVAIHPFDDGNGRLSRILMNLILMQNSYPPVVIKMDDRTNYYSLLSRADNNDNWPFVEYIAENMLNSLRLYLQAAQGDDIDEDEDIDKEIALFKMEISKEVQLKERKTSVGVDILFVEEILPMFIKIIKKVKNFDDIFFESKYFLSMKADGIKDRLYLRISELNKEKAIEFFLKHSAGKILNIALDLDLVEFKNANKHFSITAILSIDLNDYDYKMTMNLNDFVLSKMYHEYISQNDIKEVTQALINSIQNIIKIKLQ